MKRWWQAGALIVLASACERIDAPKESKQALVAPQAGVPPFFRSDARLIVAHVGMRRLEFASESGQPLFFSERIATDGQGRYSVQPIGPQGSSVPDWNAFELVQHTREGFLFRYRDFAVRDPQLFEANWTLTAAGHSYVAGRACSDFVVERVVGEPISFRISTDDGTGLILASHEYDASGQLVASMVYESFLLSFDPGAVAWHVPSNEESPVLSLEELAADSGRPLLEPQLLPDGYAPLENATITDEDGGRWLKRTYTDGIETLFFLEGLVEAGKPVVSRSLQPGPATTAAPSSVMVFKLDRATVVQGGVDGHELIVVGRVPEAELLDLIESSLP